LGQGYKHQQILGRVPAGGHERAGETNQKRFYFIFSGNGPGGSRGFWGEGITPAPPGGWGRGERKSGGGGTTNHCPLCGGGGPHQKPPKNFRTGEKIAFHISWNSPKNAGEEILGNCYYNFVEKKLRGENWYCQAPTRKKKKGGGVGGELNKKKMRGGQRALNRSRSLPRKRGTQAS